MDISKYIENNCRKLFFMSTLLFICLTSVSLSHAETGAAGKSNDLYSLSNEKLFEQASSIISTAHNEFKTRLRATQHSEIKLQKSSNDTHGIQLADGMKTNASAGSPSGEEGILLVLELQKKRLATLDQMTELWKKEKKQLDSYMRDLKEADLAVNNLNSAFDTLASYQLEIKWRINDGSLSKRSVPDLLLNRNLAIMQRGITKEVGKLRIKQERGALMVEDMAKRKTILDEQYSAEKSKYEAAEKEYAVEKSRYSIEQEFTSIPSGKLLLKLKNFNRELLWLGSVFEQSYTEYLAQRDNISELTNKLKELSNNKPEKSSEPAVALSLEEFKLRRDEIQSELEAYQKRIKEHQKISSALKSLKEIGDKLNGDAIVLDGHLVRMQVLARIVENLVKEGKISSDKVQPDLSPSHLLKLKEEKVKLASEALSEFSSIDQQSLAHNNDIQQLNSSILHARKVDMDLKKSYEAANKMRDWNTKIAAMNSDELLDEFKSLTESLQEKKEDLVQKRAEFEAQRQNVSQEQQSYHQLAYPMLRNTREQYAGEKQEILASLLKKTGLDKAKYSFQLSEASAGSKVISGDNPAGSAEKSVQLSALKEFEYSLSGRTIYFREWDEKRESLTAVLTETKESSSAYLSVLADTTLLTRQQNGVAVELKKRVGMGQLSSNQLPGRKLLNDSLNSNVASQLDNETQAAVNELADMDRLLTFIQQKQSEQERKLYPEVLSLVVARLDNLQKRDQLDLVYSQSPEELSNIDKTELDQAVASRIENDRLPMEQVLNFIPSEQADRIQSVLHTYYFELLELERRSDNISQQKLQMEQLIKSSEGEIPLIQTLLSVTQEHIQQLKISKEEEWAKIQAGLMPEKSDELLEKFKQKSGRYFTRPEPVPQSQVVAAIEKAVEQIFRYDTEIIALEKWQELFNQRLSASGVEQEVLDYQSQLGHLAVLEGTLQRKIHHLVGDDPGVSTTAKIDPVSNSESNDPSLQKGQIGLRKDEVAELRKIAIVSLLVKVFLIVLGAILSTFILNKVIARKSSRNKTSILLPLLGSFINGIIWTAAVISLLGILGFDIGVIVAGLGIGGLALAMASKDTLSDIIGGVSIVMSKSFKVGDFLIYDGKMVTVESIGVRYTRFSGGHDNHFQIVVPNSNLAESSIVNATGNTRSLRIDSYIHLSIRNDAEKLKLAAQLVEEVCCAHDNVDFKWFILFGLKDNIFQYKLRYDAKDILKWAATRGDINTGIAAQFQKHNIYFEDRPYFNVAGETLSEPGLLEEAMLES